MPGGGISVGESGEEVAAFDTRKLLGLSFCVVLIAATWFALKVSGRRRKDATAVIES